MYVPAKGKARAKAAAERLFIFNSVFYSSGEFDAGRAIL
jgi:hypothetical protein